MESLFAKLTVSKHYQCVSCQMEFQTLIEQKEHYKSEWHRYNLKRKVANLAALSLDEYQRRFPTASGDSTDLNFYCKCCKRHFSSKNSFNNHNQSKKHGLNSTASDKNHATDTQTTDLDSNTIEDVDSDWESVDGDDDDDVDESKLSANDCLFCVSFTSNNVVDNLKHMSQQHSFFVPFVKYCVDVEGLIQYLAMKIRKYHMCIWCNDSGKCFKSVNAVLNHMQSKGHFKMIHEGVALEEYVPFYDYSSSYPDAGEGHSDDDVEDSVDEIKDEGYILKLPSGAEIGHRSLMTYYKQHYDAKSSSVGKVKAINRVVSHYKALGWVDVKEMSQRKTRDIQKMQKIQAKWQQKMSAKNNKLHIVRPSVVF